MTSALGIGTVPLAPAIGPQKVERVPSDLIFEPLSIPPFPVRRVIGPTTEKYPCVS